MKGNPLYQGFDLMQELQNPEFLSLLKAGTPVEHAYRVLHFDELMGSAVQAAAPARRKRWQTPSAQRAIVPTKTAPTPTARS